MTLFLTPNHDEDPEYVKLKLQYMAATWADLILIGLNNGEKPEILVDRSGSMDADLLKNHNPQTYSFTRMDVSLTLISLVASILSKRNKGFDLSQIPVKSWGSNVYSHGTLKDYLPAAFGSGGPPAIPCTDGTDHSHWFNESDFPLVITDDYYRVDPMFVANMKSFDWCNGANIIVIDNQRVIPLLRKVDQEVMDKAAIVSSTTSDGLANPAFHHKPYTRHHQ